ncbi:MAG: hypothetical protein WBG57_13640, partial [Ornithinimicrobium sp.]
PDTSYTDGYGIVDGVPQPFMDGLRLVTAQTIEPGRDRLIEFDDVEPEVQMYAVVLCPAIDAGETAGSSDDVTDFVDGAFSIASGDTSAQAECVAQSTDVNSNSIMAPIPPSDSSYVVSSRHAGTATVALYAEVAWGDYPFPAVDSSPFGAVDSGVVVIDSTTPPSIEEDIDGVPAGARVYRARIPVTDEGAELGIEVSRPGQILVAVDGILVSNLNAALVDQQDVDAPSWSLADPQILDDFVASFGPQVQRQQLLDRTTLERLGINTSDVGVEVTVYPRGFVDNSSWRVTYGTEATADRQPLTPATETSLPEYAMGQRLVETFEVPRDGSAWPLRWDRDGDEELTWVADCSDREPGSGGGPLEADAATVTRSTGVGRLSCFRDSPWSFPLQPADFQRQSGQDQTTLTALATDDDSSLVVAAYEPVPFDEFPFNDSGDVLGLGDSFGGEEALAQRDGNDDFVERDTAFETLDDLDEPGTITLDVPDTRLNQFYVTTEGQGRFWIEPLNPEGATITSDASLFMGIEFFGRDGYWTSWTEDRITWPIEAKTDAGDRPEQVTLRVEGYEGGSFEFRVTGQFPEGEQP